MANLHNFILNSDYPIEQVIFFKQAEAIMEVNGNSSVCSVDIQHGLPFIPLPIAVCSRYKDFHDTRTQSAFTEEITKDSYNIADIRATKDKITISVFSPSKITGTMYIRVYCLRPAGQIGRVPYTNAQAGKFVFNSEYPYAPLMLDLKAGEAYNPNEIKTINIINGYKEASIDSAGAIDIIHNAGFKPYVMMWKLNPKDGQDFTEDTIVPFSYATIEYQYPLNQLAYITEEKIHIPNFGVGMNLRTSYIKVFANV